MALPSARQTIFIDHADAGYRRLVSVLAGQIRGRQVVPLFGAGISRDKPSRLPLADDIKKPLVDALWAAASPVLENRRSASTEMMKAKANVEVARLERLLDALHQTYGSTALAYLSVLNSTAWNFNHGAIAALAVHGFLPWCITLNFDLLIEEAIRARHVACETICPLIGKSFRTGTGFLCTKILKPHGSFLPPHVGLDPYRLLAATLSQAGSKPVAANIEAIRTVLAESPVLLVAGYSDDDWDIFPIFGRLKSKLRSVFWVQFAQEDVVARREIPKAALGVSDPLHECVIPWLNEFGAGAVLLVGRLDRRLADLIAEPAFAGLDMRIEPPDSLNPPAKPDASVFQPHKPWTDVASIKTGISLAMLLQHTGEFSLELLDWLEKLPEVRANPEYAWRVEHLLAHTEHTRNRVRFAIPHMKRVIELKYGNANVLEQVAGDKVWLGYEYLCLAKRPDPRRPLWLFALPIFILRGLLLMREGVRTTPEGERAKQRALAKFYRIDLLHSWANLAMLFGHKSARLFKPYFWWVAKLYERLARQSDIMSGEYYWLRHLEARLLAGVKVDASVQELLDEIERSNALIQENVQVGNTYAYRALLNFTQAGNLARTQELLNRAEEKWLQSGRQIESGKRRVILFRRFLFPETVPFRSALNEILKRGEAWREDRSGASVKSAIESLKSGRADCRALVALIIQVSINFASRNENAAESGQFPKHFPAYKPSDRFFANTQFRGAAFHVVSLTFEGCDGIHKSSFTRQSLRLIATELV